MTKPRKLLFVVNDAAYFLSHRLALAVEARNTGFEVHVATPEGPATTAIVNYGFTFHSIPLTRKGCKPWQEFSSIVALVCLYRRLQPDIVHHITIKPVLYGGITARFACVPGVVNAVTGLGYVFVTKGFKAALLRSAVMLGYRIVFSHRNQRVIFQNPDDSALFVDIGIVTKKDTVIIKGSGVDISIFIPHPELKDTPLVILASRMLWDKGVGTFVEAALKLQTNGVKARFALVGDTDPGNPSAIPFSQLEAWRKSGVVEWWGRCDDMPAVFAQSHVVCLPSSYGEGVPKVLIEAAACGRAIVATDAPGCREIVRHGENGLLVPVRNSEALADALQKLIDDPVLRARMGKRGREIAVTEFAQERVVDETLRVYQELLRNRIEEDLQII